MWVILAHENLPSVGLATKVNLLGVDLIGDVDEEDVKEVIASMIRLEDDLDLVGLVGWDGRLLGDHHERHLFAVILHAIDLRLEAEVDWEGRNVFDHESLFSRLAHDHVAEG